MCFIFITIVKYCKNHKLLYYKGFIALAMDVNYIAMDVNYIRTMGINFIYIFKGVFTYNNDFFRRVNPKQLCVTIIIPIFKYILLHLHLTTTFHEE